MRKYLSKYTLCFIICALGVYAQFFIHHHGFAYVIDGYYQHYRAMCYFGDYLKDIFHTFSAQGKLVIPSWDFSIGEGADVLTNFHYYIIGDPLLWIAGFVPKRFYPYFYDFISLFRLYLSGITFYVFCREIGYNKDNNILFGGLTYAFGFWGMLSVARHPFFVWPLVYMPLLLAGAERIRRNGKSKLFVISVALAAITSFYWLYVLAALCAVYVLVRIVYELRAKTPMGDVAGWVIRLALSAILGVLPAAVILVPVVMFLSGGARTSSSSQASIFYSLNYYVRTGFDLIADYDNIDWRLLGFSIPAILAGIMAFVKKRTQRLSYIRTFIIICTLILFSPLLGKVFNGFAYATNRWCFAFLFVVSIALVELIDSFEELSVKEFRWQLGLVVLYGIYLTGVNLIIKNVYVIFLYALLLVLAIIISPRFAGKLGGKRKAMTFVILIAGIIILGNNKFWFYVEHSTLSYDDIKKGTEQNELTVLREYKEKTGDEDFSRYTSKIDCKNNNVVMGLFGTDFYWSLSNNAVSQFRLITEQKDYRDYSYAGYNSSTIYNELASVKYFIKKHKDGMAVPYGYNMVSSKTIEAGPGAGEYDLYENSNALPLAYSYNSVMSLDEFKKLSVTQKMEAMLCAAIIDDDDAAALDLPTADINYDSVKLDSGFKGTSGNVEITNNVLKVNERKSKLKMSYSGIPSNEAEVWAEIKGLDYKQSMDKSDIAKLGNRKDEIAIKFNLPGGNWDKLYYYTPNHAYYWGRRDFSINLGALGTQTDSIGLKLYELGDYNYDSFELWALPMDNYDARVAALKNDSLQNVEINTDEVEGDIKLNAKKLLCYSIPYSKGWTAYVDGKQAPIYQTNIKNMAVLIDAGSHHVVLKYETPGFKIGAIISIIGVLLIIVVFLSELFWTRRRV